MCDGLGRFSYDDLREILIDDFFTEIHENPTRYEEMSHDCCFQMFRDKLKLTQNNDIITLDYLSTIQMYLN
jgi:hypothetical protein